MFIVVFQAHANLIITLEITIVFLSFKHCTMSQIIYCASNVQSTRFTYDDNNRKSFTILQTWAPLFIEQKLNKTQMPNQKYYFKSLALFSKINHSHGEMHDCYGVWNVTFTPFLWRIHYLKFAHNLCAFHLLHFDSFAVQSRSQLMVSI